MSSHRTVDPHATAEDCPPPDIDTMRASARRSLTEEPEPDEAETLALLLRGHIEILIPEVEKLARHKHADDIPRICALACVGEARGKLRIGLGQTPLVRVATVQKLGRSVNALCDHYENLGGRS